MSFLNKLPIKNLLGYRWFKNLSIKYKIVILLYIGILPFLIILIGYLYFTMQKSTKDSLSQAYLEVARQINENIAFIQTDIEDISTYISINGNVKLALQEGSGVEELHLTWNADSSMNFFMDIIGTKSYISFVALYADNGHEPYYITTDTSVLIGDINSIKATRYYKKANEYKGAPLWFRLNKDNKEIFIINKSDKLLMNRVIIDHLNVENIGFLMLGLNASYIEQLCLSMTNEGENIIVKSRGEILIESGEMNQRVKAYIESDEINHDIGTRESGIIMYQDNMIYFDRITNKKLDVFYIISNQILKERSGVLNDVPKFLSISVLLLLFPISILLANSIAKPLKAITDSMQLFKKGDFQQRVNYDSGDEIGEVASNYNDMVQNIKELIDNKYLLEIKERESELNTLQAQINPHFLYNTLDSIYWKLMEDGSHESAEMVYSLSRIFRLSLNRGQGLTTLEKEIELVENYLNIQKMRFNEKLTFTITIDETIKESIIPKLILQPFVENAVIHGIEQEDKIGEITITAEHRGYHFYFCIEDNGKGMSSEQISKLLYRVDNDVNVSKTPGGYAIYNVYERLKLKYKDDFTLQIHSKVDEGTRVVMIIPDGIIK